jgi:hypothetical protein
MISNIRIIKEISNTVFKVPNSNYQATYWLDYYFADPVPNGVSCETLLIGIS